MPTKQNFRLLYNKNLLAWQMARLNKSPEQIAEESGMSKNSVNAGLGGTLGTMKMLRLLCDTLKVNWNFITHVDLPETEFRRAVLNGDSVAGRR